MIVNIYLGMSRLTKRDFTASGVYVLEAVKGNTQITNENKLTTYEVMEFDHTNSTVIALTLLQTALKRIQKTDKLQIFTDNLAVLSISNNLYLFRQSEQTEKNKIVMKYESLWTPIWKMLRNYEWSVSDIRYEQKVLIQNILQNQGGQKHVG